MKKLRDRVVNELFLLNGRPCVVLIRSEDMPLRQKHLTEVRDEWAGRKYLLPDYTETEDMPDMLLWERSIQPPTVPEIHPTESYRTKAPKELKILPESSFTAKWEPQSDEVTVHISSEDMINLLTQLPTDQLRWLADTATTIIYEREKANET